MIGRCHRPSDSSYKWYGAKGVTVCDNWRKFENFFADMGTAPDRMHIHRTNGATVYSKETCQWMNEHEHIGLHNQEKGWGARMTRAELIDAFAGAKSALAAEEKRADDSIVENVRLMKELDAERERADRNADAIEFATEKWSKANIEIQQLRSQLDIERSKPKTTEYAQGWDDHVLAVKPQLDQLKSQLADSEHDRIEAGNNFIESQRQREAIIKDYQAECDESERLRQRIIELTAAQLPLVNALERIRDLVEEYASGSNSPAVNYLEKIEAVVYGVIPAKPREAK